MTEESKKSRPEKSEEEISEDLKNLVVSRLELLSPNKKFFIGSHKEGFTKEDLIRHVKKGDEVGKKVAEMEMTFLRALKDGTLLKEVLNSER
ncbi:MAG: hypothetical protein ACKKMV_01455 [Candidatus Nealsonbacteria bacterium]